MQNRFVVTLAAFASIAAVAAPAAAQDAAAPAAPMAATVGHPWEFGVDAGANFNLGTPKVTTVGVPVQSFRFGYFVNDRISLEPMVALNTASGGGFTVEDYKAALGLLWHMHTSPAGEGPYVRPFAGFYGSHVSGSTTSNGVAGAGLGIKFPWGDRMATRFEANYTHTFQAQASGNSGANNNIGVTAGLSFFTR
jgi:hypothetical protein